MSSHTIRNRKYDLPIIIGISIVILFIFSKNSWLYSTNDWVDANAFMTVGNAWDHNIIPYKDIFEQKGPLLYLIYGFAAKTGLWFHGIFILECVLMAISLWLLSTSFQLLSNNRLKINITLLIYVIGFVFMPYFDRGGGVEEIATVAIVYLLYLVTRFVKKYEIYAHQLIIAAVLFTIIFWIKYTMILSYLVLLIAYIAYLYLNRSFHKILIIILINILAFGFISAVIIIYFYLNGAISQLFDVYFIDNITKYSGNNLGGANHPIITWLIYFRSVLIIFLPIMMISIVKPHNKFIKNNLIIVLLIIISLNFVFSNNYRYYSLIVYPIVIYLLFISNLSSRILTLTTIALSIYVIANNLSLYQTVLSKHQSPGQVVMKTTHGSKSVVQIGVLDSGIYNLSHNVPPTKYFQLNNINPAAMPMLINEPANIISSRHIKYVVTTQQHYNLKQNSLFKNYTVVKSFHPYSNNTTLYYILELKGN